MTGIPPDLQETGAETPLIPASVHQDAAGLGAMTDDSSRPDRPIQQVSIPSIRSLTDPLVTAAPLGMAYLDRDLRFVRINPALARMNGVSEPQHIDRSLAELMPNFWSKIGPIRQQVLEKGESVLNLEIIEETPDPRGSRRCWIVDCYPVYDGDEILGMGMAVIDISDRMQVERQRLRLAERKAQQLASSVNEAIEALRLAREQAEAAERAKSAFLSNISHELRTPLHTILGYAHIIGRHLDDAFSDKMAVIERSGGQLLRLIDELLNFSRSESRPVSLEPRSVNLESLIGFLRESGHAMAERRGNRFVVDIGCQLPDAVEVDEQRLIQVLFNLISNACKFTKHGQIRLGIAVVKPELAEGIRHCGSCPMHHFRFEVEDSGVGIPISEQGRIFEPFARGIGSERQPGTGLGLAIARQLVQAMGGDIFLESTPGRGSRFFFTLCLAAAKNAAQPSQGRQRGPIIGYRGPPLTLMVVDDIAENRTFLQDLCAEWGFRVALAADGEEALLRCSTADCSIAAVLVDQFMPRMDGWEFLRRARAARILPGVPIILVSAALPDRPDDFPPDHQFDGMLLKPIVPEHLTDLLQRLLGLQWQRKDTNTNQDQAIAWSPLPPESLEEFRTLLDLGRVVALQRWAKSLSKSSAGHAEFAKEVARLAGNIDLPGLHRLLAQVNPKSGAAY